MLARHHARFLVFASLAVATFVAISCGGATHAPERSRIAEVDAGSHEIAAPSTASIEGEIVLASGEPAAGALVSVWSHFDPDVSDVAFDTTSDARGHFRFVGVPDGRCAVTATLGGTAAAYGGVVELRAGSQAPQVTLRLGVSPFAIDGFVRDASGAPMSDARIIAASFSDNEDEVYVTRTDAAGHYRYALPAGVPYLVVADAPPRVRSYRRIDANATDADLVLGPPPAPRPSDEAIAAWLRARATPLSARTWADAEAHALAAIVGDAKVVAIGEATHGSAEFAETRQKAFEALVRDAGFNVFAIEAGMPDALALDDYVLHGPNDIEAAKRALRGLGTWAFETTEMLALVKWMRDYNAAPTHTRKLRFEAFDVYTPRAVPRILAYLAKVDPASVEGARAALAPFANVGCDATYPKLDARAQSEARRVIDALLASMDAHHAAYVAKSSEDTWARTRQLVRVVQQAEASYRDESLRETYMTENIRWLVAHHAPGSRFVLAAHNGHVAASGHGLLDMGRLLRKEWAAGYVAIGFAFGDGATRALDWQKGREGNAPLRSFPLGRAPTATFDGALGLAKLPAFVVDLRTADAPILAWLASPQAMHHVSGGYTGPDDLFQTYAPARAFDAILYVDHLSASHRLDATKM